MLKLDQLEMQRTLRLNLVQSEPQIADIVRQSCDLDEAAWPQDQLLAHTRRGLDQAIVFHYALVFVLGAPGYFRRFGFDTAAKHNYFC